MLQRYLDPSILAGISGLELIAKTVVDGFVSGLHRSPDFGFSQEFAEYRAYAEGDDLRHVDWNVFARSERMYLKRYRGETNSQLTLVLDASASMGFGAGVKKLDYARYLAASLFYLANQQRDAAGMLVFAEGIQNYVPPSSRQGQFLRLLHAIEKATLGTHTDYAQPFLHCQQFLHRRGLIVVISDFYNDPQDVIRAMEPLRYRGNELILFHLLDPQEIQPSLAEPMLLVDMETGEALESTPDYVRTGYKEKMGAHLAGMRDAAQRAGMDYFLMNTGKPLDEGLREYLTVRKGRN